FWLSKGLLRESRHATQFELRVQVRRSPKLSHGGGQTASAKHGQHTGCLNSVWIKVVRCRQWKPAHKSGDARQENEISGSRQARTPAPRRLGRAFSGAGLDRRR